MGHELVARMPKGIRAPKVILMSGHNTLADRSVQDAVASAYLSKPFDTDLLLRVVRATLDEVSAPV
jgi:DNA-binding response OmpR family regulator